MAELTIRLQDGAEYRLSDVSAEVADYVRNAVEFALAGAGAWYWEADDEWHAELDGGADEANIRIRIEGGTDEQS